MTGDRSRVIATFVQQRSTRFLGFLLLVDAIFIAIHLLHQLPITRAAFPVLNDPFLSLTEDLSYAEFFQYVKEVWIALMLTRIAVRGGGAVYAGWAALFLYFFLDDSVQIHETLGAAVARIAAHVPFLQPHAQDVGEMFVVACIGLCFVALIAVAHHRSGSAARQASRHLVLMVSLLVFFGVVVDFIHALFADASDILSYGLGMVEDSGEMLAMSLVCWYAFRLCTERASER